MRKDDPYNKNLDVIQQVIGFTCRRQRLDPQEAEDFQSWVNLKLLDKDARILRQFKGRSSLKTYLVTVVQRLFQDYRIEKWGKWRPSAAAKRLGPIALHLDQLVSRDGYGYEEAIEVLLTNHHVQTSREELAQLSAQLPLRLPRTRVEESQLEMLGDDRAPTDRGLVQKENQALASKTVGILEQVLKPLDSENRVILKMHFWDGMTVAQISKILGLDQKSLYRRIKRTLDKIRGQMETKGLNSEEVLEIIAKTNFPVIKWDDHSAIDLPGPSP